MNSTSKSPSYTIQIKEMLSNPRELEVIRLRSEGKTLNEIGKLHNITRERIRQIERSPFNKIKSLINDNLDDILKASLKNNVVIDTDSFNDLFGEYDLIVKYVLFGNKENNLKHGLFNICYCRPLNLMFIYNKNLYNKLSVDNIDVFEKSEVNNFTKEIQKYGISTWTNDDTKELFLSNGFEESKKAFFRGDINIGDAIRYISLKEEFSNGIKVGKGDISDKDSVSIEEMCKELSDYFLLKPSSTASLSARVSDVLFIWDKSTYVNEAFIEYDPVLIEKIEDFCKKSKGKQFSYLSLYKYFKDDIEKYSNCKNHNALHGLLDLAKSKDETTLGTSRHYVSYDEDGFVLAEEHYKALYDFLLEKGQPVSINEIKKKFPLVTNSSVRRAKTYFPAIVNYNNGYLMNIDSIKYTKGETENIIDAMNNIASDYFSYINMNNLYDYIKGNHPNILKKTFARDAKSFALAINNIITDVGYQYRYPHFTKGLDKSEISKETIMLEVIKNKEMTKSEAVNFFMDMFQDYPSSVSFILNNSIKKGLVKVKNDKLYLV